MDYFLYISFILVFGYVSSLYFEKGVSSWADIRLYFYSLTPSGKAERWNEYHELLLANSAFFKNLSPEGRKVFIVRCSKFISAKVFIGMEGLEVTKEMKLKIAATAVQVTYGLKSSTLSHFHTIKIYPETFYSRMLDNYLKGGTSPGGSMFFSWEDFELGFADPADRYNLGLHEMAHALRVQLRHGTDFDSRFANYVDDWVELALPEFERMNEGNTSFLREYGGTNIEEFFAVCVEHFFEVPVEFKKQLPDIYNHLSFLLNMDPLRHDSDYKLLPDFVETVNRDKTRMPIPERVSKNYDYDSWHWSYNFVVAGLFVCTPVIFVMHGKVLFTGLQIFLIFLTITSVMMIFRKFFLKKGLGLFHHLLLFCVAGASPLLTVFILTSNYYFKLSYSVNTYKVVTTQRVSIANAKGFKTHDLLTLKYRALDDFKEIRLIPAGMIPDEIYPTGLYLSVTTSTGVWGLENFEDKAIIVTESTEKTH